MADTAPNARDVVALLLKANEAHKRGRFGLASERFQAALQLSLPLFAADSLVIAELRVKVALSTLSSLCMDNGTSADAVPYICHTYFDPALIVLMQRQAAGTLLPNFCREEEKQLQVLLLAAMRQKDGLQPLSDASAPYCETRMAYRASLAAVRFYVMAGCAFKDAVTFPEGAEQFAQRVLVTIFLPVMAPPTPVFLQDEIALLRTIMRDGLLLPCLEPTPFVISARRWLNSPAGQAALNRRTESWSAQFDGMGSYSEVMARDVARNGLQRCAGCDTAEAHPKQFKKCSRCNGPKYCSTACQANDWGVHKAVCNAGA
jgi:hypothetical protein